MAFLAEPPGPVNPPISLHTAEVTGPVPVVPQPKPLVKGGLLVAVQTDEEPHKWIGRKSDTIRLPVDSA